MRERLEPHTEEPAREKHITDMAFGMHQDSITTASLRPHGADVEVRKILHEPNGPARACYEAGPVGMRLSGSWPPGGSPARWSRPR